ncbi:hypothetical protein R0381_001339 [Jeongeupia wiesaeckerbachi]
MPVSMAMIWLRRAWRADLTAIGTDSAQKVHGQGDCGACQQDACGNPGAAVRFRAPGRRQHPPQQQEDESGEQKPE